MRRALARRLAGWIALLAAIAPAAGAQEPAPLDARQRLAIADSIAGVLERRYVDSTIARRLGATLRARVRSGAYEAQVTPAAYAAALMRDVQGVVPDKHLRVTWEPGRDFAGMVVPARTAGTPAPATVRNGATGAAPNARPGQWTRIDPRDSAEVARTNFAFDRVERLDGNVGYLKLSQFVPLDWSLPTAQAAMAFLANTDAVILDLRGNIGGAPQLMQLLLSHFTPRPMRLGRTYSRALNVTNEWWTLDSLVRVRLAGKPLYVLQDRNSASSAEALAYVVRQHALGTVVGDTSSGAGNGGNMQSVGAGIALFVPMFTVVDGPGYERTGVAPDVRVAPDSALAVAHRLALTTLVAAAPDTIVKKERTWALELASAAPTPGPALAAYAGTFGPRRFVVEQGRLVHVGATGTTTRLTPVARDTFRSSSSRFRFERDSAGQVVAVVAETMAGRVTRTPRDSGALAGRD